tara:strand:- start:202 stop:327 length:126 start_codon:yes stop_codon:yes gene_type:complete
MEQDIADDRRGIAQKGFKNREKSIGARGLNLRSSAPKAPAL